MQGFPRFEGQRKLAQNQEPKQERFLHCIPNWGYSGEGVLSLARSFVPVKPRSPARAVTNFLCLALPWPPAGVLGARSLRALAPCSGGSALRPCQASRRGAAGCQILRLSLHIWRPAPLLGSSSPSETGGYPKGAGPLWKCARLGRFRASAEARRIFGSSSKYPNCAPDARSAQ
jgi:hypothetical protein